MKGFRVLHIQLRITFRVKIANMSRLCFVDFICETAAVLCAFAFTNIVIINMRTESANGVLVIVIIAPDRIVLKRRYTQVSPAIACPYKCKSVQGCAGKEWRIRWG